MNQIDIIGIISFSIYIKGLGFGFFLATNFVEAYSCILLVAI